MTPCIILSQSILHQAVRSYADGLVLDEVAKAMQTLRMEKRGDEEMPQNGEYHNRCVVFEHFYADEHAAALVGHAGFILGVTAKELTHRSMNIADSIVSPSCEEIPHQSLHKMV